MEKITEENLGATRNVASVSFMEDNTGQIIPFFLTTDDSVREMFSNVNDREKLDDALDVIADLIEKYLNPSEGMKA